MTLLKGILIVGICAWSIFGLFFWVVIHDKSKELISPPKTWKLAILLPFCGPIPIIVICLVKLGNLLENATNTLAEWVTK